MFREKSIDVISVCSADGEIRPLRFRLEDENREHLRIDIDAVVSTKAIPYVGVEAQLFICSATVHGRHRLFELKYRIRTHSWTLCRTLPGSHAP